MNLSVSDLMFCCFNLPLATSTFWHGSWHHGALLCRLFPLLRYGLVAVSLFTILAITFNRYIMIGHPRFYPRLYKPKYLIPMILSTWILAFGVLIITWFESWGRFGLDVAIGSCSILPDVNGRSPKEFLFVIAFLIPCIAIIVCYARIFYIVRKTAHKSRNRNAAASTDTIEVNHERRSVSPRNQEEELSILGSSCSPGILCANFSSKRIIASSNRLSCSRTPSGSALEESLSEQPTRKRNSVKREEEEEKQNEEYDEDREQIKHQAENWKGSDKEQVNRSHCEILIPKNVETCDKVRSGLEIKIDDIPYADDPEAAVTVFLSSDQMKIKDSTDKASANARNKLERMASRASFIIESALWVQRLNSKSSTGGDRLNSPRSNSPDRSLKRKPTIFFKESRFKSVRRFRNAEGPPRMSNKDRKLLKMILVIFSSFFLCYLPITVTKTFKDAIDWRGLNIAGYILIYLTTCINPVVYVVMSSEYRSAYKSVLLCRDDTGMKSGDRKPLG